MKITSLEEMKSAAVSLLSCASKTAGPGKGALVLLLSGELGSGKTAFVQALARELGIRERITSPTFVIQKEYEIQEEEGARFQKPLKFKRLIHIDAYRLKTFSELEMLGWNEFIQSTETIIAIEWPEQVGLSAWHENAISLSFSHVSENVRSLLFNGKETMC